MSRGIVFEEGAHEFGREVFLDWVNMIDRIWCGVVSI